MKQKHQETNKHKINNKNNKKGNITNNYTQHETTSNKIQKTQE